MSDKNPTSARLESTKLNTQASILSSLTKLYESAATIVAASTTAGKEDSTANKKRTEFAQKEMEKWSKKIDVLLSE